METTPPDQPLKTCRRCNQKFPPTTEFFNRAGKYLQSYCKPCEKTFYHENYERVRDLAYELGTRKKKIPLTPERRREQANAYYHRHRERITAKARARYAIDEAYRESRSGNAGLGLSNRSDVGQPSKSGGRRTSFDEPPTRPNDEPSRQMREWNYASVM